MIIKNCIAGCLCYSGWIPARNWFRSLIRSHPITILVYHRINDVYPDEMTISCSAFRKQIAFISRYYSVVSLRDVIIMLQQKKRLSRKMVAVTFDDGYRDISTNAAPILRQYNVPATVFVNPHYVGVYKQFAHDKRFGHAFETLNWEELHQLKNVGFEIGSHGMSHRRLRDLTPEEVSRELMDSKHALMEKELIDRLFFAPPIGRIQDETPELKSLVREAGYECCLFAYGGYNPTGTDLFSLKRVNVSPNMNDTMFRLYLEGIDLGKYRASLAKYRMSKEFGFKMRSKRQAHV